MCRVCGYGRCPPLSFVEVTPNVFLFLLFLTTLAAAARLQLVAGGLAVSADPSLSTSHIRIYPLSRGYPTLLLPVHSSLHFRLWRLFSPSALFQGFHPRREPEALRSAAVQPAAAGAASAALAAHPRRASVRLHVRWADVCGSCPSLQLQQHPRRATGRGATAAANLAPIVESNAYAPT